MTTLTLYDEKCHDLARYFYPKMDEQRLNELAALIQVTVEDFAPPDPEEENGDAASGPRNGLTCDLCQGTRTLFLVTDRTMENPVTGKPHPITELRDCPKCVTTKPL